MRESGAFINYFASSLRWPHPQIPQLRCCIYLQVATVDRDRFCRAGRASSAGKTSPSAFRAIRLVWGRGICLNLYEEIWAHQPGHDGEHGCPPMGVRATLNELVLIAECHRVCRYKLIQAAALLGARHCGRACGAFMFAKLQWGSERFG